MTDFDIFVLALADYLEGLKECSVEEQKNRFVKFQETIQNLNCNDFRFYFYRAHYLNVQDKMDEAKSNIDNAITLTYSINAEFLFSTCENCAILWLPDIHNEGRRYPLNLSLNSELSKVYLCAGEIYAKIGDENLSLKYYQIGQYYGSLLKSDFEKQKEISVFSFRKFNEYSLSDLINNTITVSPSINMNDPLDSVINLWGKEKKTYKSM